MTEQQRYHEAQRNQSARIAAEKAAREAGNVDRDPNYQPRHAKA